MSYNNNNIPKADKAVAEDTPEMRSIALHSATAGSVALRSEPSLTMQKVARSTAAPKSSKTNLWNVVAAPELPPYYFLERTHVRVPDLTLKEVAERIVDCLREASIATQYDAEKAIVHAETSCNMQFSVRLWKDKGVIVVEVQRAAGCSCAFHQASKAVLRAAKGLSRSLSPQRQRSFSLPSCIPPRTPEEHKEDLKEGLEIAASLLEQDEVDAQLMALESLHHLTKVCSTECFAAEYILEHDNIFNALLSLIGDSGVADERGAMRREALSVLARCLCTLKNSGKLPVTLRRLSSHLLAKDLTTALVDQVLAAREQPHEACQALSSLQCMTEVSREVRQRTLELGIEAAISVAEREGHVRHKELEESCVRFMRAAKQA